MHKTFQDKNMSYNLKYRTFEQLMADVSSDFKSYQLKNLIDSQDIIKIARKVNYELGLRIHTTKERILYVERNKVKLPSDFYVFNFALSVGSYKIRQYLPQGTHVEERIVGKIAPSYQVAPQDINFCEAPIAPVDTCDPCDPCAQCGQVNNNCEPCHTCCANPDSCTLNCNGDVTQLVQVLKSEVRTYDHVGTLRLVRSDAVLMENCPNLSWASDNTCTIKDGWLHTSFQTGKVYLNYQGQMEDEHGNLLVVDHPLLNEYYEYSAKKRILENLILNDVDIPQHKIQIINQEYRTSRIAAHSLVHTPDFAEIQELMIANRKSQHFRYYNMFKNH